MDQKNCSCDINSHPPKPSDIQTTTKISDSIQSHHLNLPLHLYSRLQPHQLLPDGSPDYLQLILSSRVYDLIPETPLTQASNLSHRLGVSISLKREDLQPVFSFKVCWSDFLLLCSSFLFLDTHFKLTTHHSWSITSQIRGAYNMMSHLSSQDQAKGVMACSAGQFSLLLSSKILELIDYILTLFLSLSPLHR